ncbi:hypothetical protein [Nocardia pseudobrasiliensis]|nr:hypothetical protein [Nocardia pseudobrasiliensis]
MSTIGPTTQQDLLEQFDQSIPHGMHWDIRSRTVAAPTSAIRDLLIAWAQARPGPAAGIGLRQFHGAATRIGSDDTAFGLRTSHTVIQISAGRTPGEDPGPFRDWAEKISTALAPHALSGGYPNFLLPRPGRGQRPYLREDVRVRRRIYMPPMASARHVGGVVCLKIAV